MARSLDAVARQMMACGMPEIAPHELEVDGGRIVRYGPKKRGWYRIFHATGRTGRSFYSGAFGLHGRIETTRIEADDAEVDPADRERLRQQVEAAKKRDEERRLARARRAERSAGEAWREARTPTEPVGYVKRKGVRPQAVKVEDEDVVLVPMLRYDLPRERALVGLQRIWPDGTKRFIAGTAKAGASVRLGPRPVDGDPILLCEGIATGLSIAEALEDRLPIFVGFDAGNLVEVALILRELWPGSPIGICADDDYRTPGNPGRLYAHRAARKVSRAWYLRPLFDDARPEGLTDFNDVHVHAGLAELRRQLQPFVGFLAAR